MKLNVAQVLGLNTDQKAAQVTSLIRDGDDAFFAVLELVSDDAFTKGRLALSELSDFYFEAEGTPSEKLNVTYEEAKKKFEGAEFDILVASILGKVLYFIGLGNVEVFLKRAEKISSLFSIGAPAQLVSGFLQEGDRIFFATKNLTDVLSDDIHQSLNLPMDAFEGDLTDRIGALNSEGNGLAGLLVEVEKEVESVAIESLDQKVEQQPVMRGESITFSRFLLTKIPEKTFFLLIKLNSFIPKSGRGKLILAAILLIFLAGGLALRFKSAKDEQKQTLFNQTLKQARDDFNAAKGLSTLNRVEAKARLDSAKDEIDKALSLKPKDEEGKNLKAQISQESASILQQSKVSEFPIFLDLNLVKENFNATRMSLSSGKILLLDPTVKTLVLVDIGKKTNQILAGSQTLGEATFVSLNGALAFVFSKDKGILRVDTGSQKITEVAKTDQDLGQIADLYGFAGNVYLLDTIGKDTPNNGQIWKYLPIAEGYSGKREYLTAGTKPDFAGSLRMQIESSVYVLKSGGEMLRFTRGEKDHFGYEGLDRGVLGPKSFFVSSDTENLYLLDSGNSRLLILTKTGSYKGQIEGEKFATSTDLVVDEVGKKVYLLDGSKIYSVDLK
ncbi:hypothetical protein HYS96_00755 [Candidatus Daviesbacteria bacterium]|nr:hypothetical protein [Candidatus Daviesbacteria bacterium]